MDKVGRARSEVLGLWEHRNYVLRVLQRHLRSAPQADLVDLLHDVFVSALESLAVRNEHIRNPKAWLAVLATRAAIDHLRATAGRIEVDAAALLRLTAEEDADTRVILMDLARRLERDETLRKLLAECPPHELTARHVGRILGIGRGRKARDTLLRVARSLAELTNVGGRWAGGRGPSGAPPKKVVPKNQGIPTSSSEPTPESITQGVVVKED